jgi:hypothetical protein
MTQLPLNNLENNRSARHLSPAARMLVNAVKTFWRFSQFYGDYQSTPPWERHAKLSQMGHRSAQPSKTVR